MGSVSASKEKVVCTRVCFKRLTKFQVKKNGLIGLQDSYQDRLVLFIVHMCNEFHVPHVLIVLLNTKTLRGTDSNKSNHILKLSDFPKLYPATL